ncbi:MAG: FMN-binding protein [Candidatus Omnitrophica bacterium]|nr:FMN-binding protein [Candidatus Omnitrophota bacterium]MCB9720288.1 FMN-binding protein [Candidatus Omnitrophota bacterium]
MKKTLLIIILTLGAAATASGAHLITVEKALPKIYRDADRFESEALQFDTPQMERLEEAAQISFGASHAPGIIRHTAIRNGTPVGVAFEDTVVGKWGPIHYVVGLDTSGNVEEVVILDYYEIRGKPAAKRRFLKQYRGKGVSDPIRLRKDIDGVTGATITSRSLTDGVRKTVHIHSLISSE